MSPNNNSPTSPRVRIPAGAMSPELANAFRGAARREQLMKPVIRRALDRAANALVEKAHEIVRPNGQPLEARDKEPSR
jgi:hypothetical protein